MAGVGGRIKPKWRTTEVTRRIRAEMVRRLNHCGEVVASHARKMVSESTRAHGPSLPGDPPHTDTGRLRNSISHGVEDRGMGKLVAIVGSNVEYAPYLELGTKRMAARPFLLRAIEEKQTEIRDILSRPM